MPHGVYEVSRKNEKNMTICILLYKFQNTIAFSKDSFILISSKLFGFQGNQPMCFPLR